MAHLIKAMGIAALFLAVSTASTAAWALDRQLQLGGDLSYAHEFADGDSRPGGGGGLHVWYGLTDYIAIGGMVGYAAHSASADPESGRELRHVITAAAGMYLVLDIIRVVPYIGVLTGAAVSLQGETSAGYLLNICGGADVLVTPSFTTGLELAYQLVIGDDVLPARLVASIRLNWRHVFF